MSIVYRLNGALLPFQSVRLQGNDGATNGFPSFAFMGQPGIAGVRIEDPSGTITVNGWDTFTVEETACSKPRIFSGWVMGRGINRGPYRTSGGRIWNFDIIDQNALFGFQVFRSTHDSVRPAETDIVRVQAVIDSGPMAATPIHNNGRFVSTGPRGLAAGNFVGQTPAEDLGSTAGQSGKNFYAYWDDSARQISLHYDAINTGPAAGISISNVLSDVTSDAGGTCYAPFIDAQQTTDSTNLASGVLEHWAGGYLYDENDSLFGATEFSPVAFKRDFVYQTDRISKAATAATYLQIELDRHSREDVTLTCSITVRAAHVNLLNAGDVVNVRFSHIPGYTTSTAVVVKSRNVEPTPGSDELYNIHLELSNFGTARGAGGGGPGVFPVPSCKPQLVQSDASDPQAGDDSATLVTNGFTVGITPTPGNIQIIWVAQRDDVNSITPTGFTSAGTGLIPDPATGGGHKSLGCQFFYRTVPDGATRSIAFTKTGGSYRCYLQVTEWSGVDTFNGLTLLTTDADQSGTGDMAFGWTVTNPGGRPVVDVCGILPSLNINDSWHPSWVHLATELGSSNTGDTGQAGNAPLSTVAYMAGPGPANDFTVAFTCVNPASGASILRGYALLIVQFLGTCPDTPAEPGQPVGGEQPPSVGGGQTVFTTGIPYAEGSLKVYVDGLRQPATETDPASGSYTLLFDPRPDEYVVVDYQARTGG